ncbi:hypothetical protein ACQW02_03865 [Humitalea sp. 24SJ18S-53]|uniref:hypothetical protein n=1 Tax=Humitalea sp. 24SJ18S-53 TaxID=3422307 RepID=UPI003D67A3BA
MPASRLLVCALSLGLAACAGRAPAPVAVVQPMDESMDCNAIQAEVAANNQRLSALGSESGAKVAQNVIAGVAGAIFILPLFLMDFQGAAGIDERSIQARNAYLSTLARARCTTQAPVA